MIKESVPEVVSIHVLLRSISLCTHIERLYYFCRELCQIKKGSDLKKMQMTFSFVCLPLQVWRGALFCLSHYQSTSSSISVSCTVKNYSLDLKSYNSTSGDYENARRCFFVCFFSLGNIIKCIQSSQ